MRQLSVLLCLITLLLVSGCAQPNKPTGQVILYACPSGDQVSNPDLCPVIQQQTRELANFPPSSIPSEKFCDPVACDKKDETRCIGSTKFIYDYYCDPALDLCTYKSEIEYNNKECIAEFCNEGECNTKDDTQCVGTTKFVYDYSCKSFGCSYDFTTEENSYDCIEENQPKISSNVSPIQEKMLNGESINVYIDSLPYGVDHKYENTIREAMSKWEKQENGINLSFSEVSSIEKADIRVGWVKEFGGQHLGFTLYNNFIEIGIGDSFCLGKWRPYNYNTVVHIAQHELGHSLEADDDYDDPNKIMYYQITTKYEYDLDESGWLEDGWWGYYPYCTHNNSATYSIAITSSEGLDIYVVPSQEHYEYFRTGDDRARHYPACEGKNLIQYGRTCNVPAGAGIVLHNPTKFGLGASASFTIKAQEVV